MTLQEQTIMRGGLLGDARQSLFESVPGSKRKTAFLKGFQIDPLAD
jgi:hypothetical protein